MDEWKQDERREDSSQHSYRGQDYDEKQEEKHEKDLQKHDEKSYEEKWRHDPVGAIVWALILIWAGLVFLADNLGVWDSLRVRASDWPWELPFSPQVWTVFFLGAGVIILAGVLLRLLVPAYRRPVLGSVIFAIVLFAIALGSWELVWPLVLIAVGASMLLSGFFDRRL
jgi:uncharacterized membrane protein